MTNGYKLKRIMMRPNGVEKQVRPSQPSIVTITDNFSGTSLNTDIWDSYITGGAITVNNGLSMSGGSNNGTVLYTKKKYEGWESKITAEYTITGEGGTYLEAIRGILFNNNFSSQLRILGQYVSTYDNTTRCFLQTGASSSTTLTSKSRVGTPYTCKLITDLTNSTYEMYINGTLYYSGSLSYTPAVGASIFAFNAYSWTSTSFSCSGITITVE